MGPFLLAFYYVCYMLFNVISPSLKWKYKTQMTYAPILYASNYITGFMLLYVDSTVMKYVITSFGALLGGFGAAILWTSMGGFLHLLCEMNGVQSSKGRFFGLFNGIYCIQSITGAFITTFGLGYFDNSTYFLLVTIIALFSSVFCQFFIKDLQKYPEEL